MQTSARIEQPSGDDMPSPGGPKTAMPSVFTHLGPRWPAAVAVLLSEYLAIGLRFDAYALRGRGLFGAEHLGKAATVLMAMAMATAILRGRRLLEDLGQARETAVTAWTWVLLALHGCCFMGLWTLSRQVFDTPASSDIPISRLVAWLVFAVATPASLWPLLVKPNQRLWLVKRLVPSALIGLLAGGAAVAMGYGSTLLWRPLGRTTLDLAAWVLSHVAEGVVSDPTHMLLGTSTFVVELAPVCSGFEGMGLLAAVLSGFIYINRARLRFPAVLAVIPVGVALVWLLNVGRIALLILIGSHGWESIAVGGFHSRAGWLAFCVVAIGLIFVIQNSRFLSKAEQTHALPREASANGDATPYLLPLIALIGTAMVTGLFAAGVDLLYPLRIVAAGCCLVAFRKSYASAAVRPGIFNVGVGVAVYAFWVATGSPSHASGVELYAAVHQFGDSVALGWISMRVLGSTIVVPIVEELAFRGYLLRRLAERDFEHVSYRHVALVPLLVSSLVFGVLHDHWIAGTVAGIAFGLAQARRGRIGDAMIAHMVSNGLIAAQVLLFDHWELWA